jgi:lysozyme
MNNITQRTINLIKHFESLHDGDLVKIGLQPKLCPAGYWTVGFGHALTLPNGNPLHDGFSKAYAEKLSFDKYGELNEAGAENLLHADLIIRGNILSTYLIKDANDNEFGAMLSLIYNIGNGAFKSSSVLRFFNQGDKQAAACSFLMWDKATVKGVKKTLRGLTIRRQAEKRLFENYPVEYN